MIFQDDYRIHKLTVAFKNPSIPNLEIFDVIYVFYYNNEKNSKLVYNMEFLNILPNPNVTALGFECRHGEIPETVILNREDVLYIKLS